MEASVHFDVPRSAASAAAPACRSRLFPWLTRSRRVLLTMAAVWALNIFDLGFTITESAHPHFVELNPIAANILGGPDAALIVYKLGLLSFGTMILLGLRKHRLAELGCWLLLSAYVYVGARWYAYYQCLWDAGRNSFVEVIIAQS